MELDVLSENGIVHLRYMVIIEDSNKILKVSLRLLIPVLWMLDN
jgi:hypothetical protein